MDISSELAKRMLASAGLDLIEGNPIPEPLVAQLPLPSGAGRLYRRFRLSPASAAGRSSPDRPAITSAPANAGRASMVATVIERGPATPC